MFVGELDPEESKENYAEAVQSSEEMDNHFVQYCREKASDSTYFIFTSRNTKSSTDKFQLPLSVLREGDACNLIKKGLTAKSFTSPDVEELAKVLQYFPLALQKAIEHINKKQEKESESEEGNVIQNYLKEFALKIKRYK